MDNEFDDFDDMDFDNLADKKDTKPAAKKPTAKIEDDFDLDFEDEKPSQPVKPANSNNPVAGKTKPKDDFIDDEFGDDFDVDVKPKHETVQPKPDLNKDPVTNLKDLEKKPTKDDSSKNQISRDHLQRDSKPKDNDNININANSNANANANNSNTNASSKPNPNPSSNANPQDNSKPKPQGQSNQILNNDQSKMENSLDADKDDMEAYMANLSDYDKERYAQLLEKNKKLKEELQVISKATEEIINKEKERKRRKYNRTEENEEVKEKMRIIKEQQDQITYYKTKIDTKKRELDGAYQYPLIREKEDQLKNLKRILSELIEERDSILKIRNEQGKALKSLEDNKEEDKRKKRLGEELGELKKENKILTDKKEELDKKLNKNHAKLVNGKLHLRELQKKIEEHKRKAHTIDYSKITEPDLAKLEKSVQAMEEEKANLQEKHNTDVKNIEKMKVELKKTNARLEKELREKDKEMRLNVVKMKELKRLQRHRAVKPMKNNIDIDDVETEGDVNKLLQMQEKEIEAKLNELNFAINERSKKSAEDRRSDNGEKSEIQREIDALKKKYYSDEDDVKAEEAELKKMESKMEDSTAKKNLVQKDSTQQFDDHNEDLVLDDHDQDADGFGATANDKHKKAEHEPVLLTNQGPSKPVADDRAIKPNPVNSKPNILTKPNLGGGPSKPNFNAPSNNNQNEIKPKENNAAQLKTDPKPAVTNVEQKPVIKEMSNHHNQADMLNDSEELVLPDDDDDEF